jgi:hypothetical protein
VTRTKGSNEDGGTRLTTNRRASDAKLSSPIKIGRHPRARLCLVARKGWLSALHLCEDSTDQALPDGKHGPTRRLSRTIPRDQHPYAARAWSTVGPGQAGPGAVHGTAGPGRGRSRRLTIFVGWKAPTGQVRYPHGVSPARAARGQPGARSNDGAWNRRGSHRQARGIGFEKHNISSRPPPSPLRVLPISLPPPPPSHLSESPSPASPLPLEQAR